MTLRTLLRLAAATALAASGLGASCGATAVSILPGVVNDPKNLSLRRSILAYGTSTMCSEVQKRSLPLRLQDDDPAIGRFFMTGCFAQELATGNLLVQFSGYGYAWTNVTKRMTFDAGGAVEYDHDFLLDDSTMYVYFRERSTSAAQFTTRLVEQPIAGTIVGLGLPGADATTIGAGIMKNELARGFTVIRDDDGITSFGIGLVPRGQRPATPFSGKSDARVLLANDRSEVHAHQRDHAGPFEVKGDDQALYLTVAIEGTQAIDMMVMPRATGDAWLQTYTREVTPTAPPSQPILAEPITAGSIYKRMVRLPAGQYYVVFDNTAQAGQTQPPMQAYDDRAALVSYAVEQGDAP